MGATHCKLPGGPVTAVALRYLRHLAADSYLFVGDEDI